MTSALGRLRHDVVKYLTRGARNVDEQAIARPLADLVLRDLYVAIGGDRPSERFAELAAAIDAESAARATRCFAEIDALELRVRAYDEAALRRAARLALEIAAIVDRAEPRT